MKNRIFCLLLAMIMVVGMLASCTPTATTPCSHPDANKDGVCDSCGASVPVTPPVCTEHVDEDGDGFCDSEGCTEEVETVCTHEDEDEDDVCDLCAAVLIQPGNYTWQKTTLKFAMNMHSHNGELSSGSKRYLAGFSDGTDLVKEVGKRNAKAAYYTKTAITYEYWSDGNKDVDITNGDKDDHDWGDSNGYIAQLLKGSSNQPDMYSTFLYDMMCASLDKSFANLKTTRADNYFAFANDTDYTDTVGDSEGYMMEFMESLTLSVNKMYLLASDYFIDTVRAFFIVPVNVDMLNALGTSVKTENGGVLPTEGVFADRTDDGEFTVDDFIELVWAREWTYDAIQQFSEKVYKDMDGDLNQSAKDILGFVLETGSGFSSTGVVYTSSITVIDKFKQNGVWNYCYPAVEKDASTGEWKYNAELDSYASAESLFKLEENVTALFRSTGVLATYNEMSTEYGKVANEREFVAIKHKFTSSGNSLLFGGFILTGNLDETEQGDYNDYQDMRRLTNGGFAIAPCPLYTAIGENEQYEDATAANYRDYQTLIHNTGRLGAISVNTKKFAQCSAFLDYQSKNSTNILEEYYQEKLCRAAGTQNDNNKVMDFIRDHVRSIFDKAFEDAIGYFYSKDNASAKKWHDMMKTDSFQPDGEIKSNYSSLAVAKQGLLIELQGEYNNLPELKNAQE